MSGPSLFHLLTRGGEAVQNAELGSIPGLRVQQSFCVKPNSALSKNLQNLKKKVCLETEKRRGLR